MKKLFYTVVLITALGLMPVTTYAQNEIREITISPFLQELDVAKGATTENIIEVTNNGVTPVSLQIVARDFLPGKRGEPEFIPDTEFNDVTFSLASWISFPEGTRLELAPQEKKAVKYFVNPPVNAEQGSHYGAILFSLSGSSTLSGVGINQSIGTIVIVGYGEARPEGQVQFIAEPKFVWWNEEVEFTNTFNNSGRVHVKPKGEIYIANIFGQLIASPSINRDAANVLPQSDRTFVAEWDPRTFAFGPYSVESVITFGNQRLELRDKQTVWVLPLYLVVPLLVAVGFVVWFAFHGRHWHRRRVITKHISKE